MEKEGLKKVGIFAAGVVVGGILGILFAPSSGKETREKIKERAKALGEKTKDTLSSFKDKAKAQIDKMRNKKEEEGEEA